MDLTTQSATGSNPAYATADQSLMVVQSMLKVYNAWLALTSSTSGTVEQETFTIDLTSAREEANALAVNFPFRSLFVRDASDNNAYFFLKPYSSDTRQGSSKMKNNTLWESGDFPCPKAWIWWPAQSGKSVVVEFHVRSRVVPGNTQQTAYVTEGSSATTAAAATVTSTAAVLLAADTDRKCTVIQNQGTVSIYVGDSTVTKKGGASPGIEIAPGDTFYWKNTGSLYAVTDSTSNTAIAALTEK